MELIEISEIRGIYNDPSINLSGEKIGAYRSEQCEFKDTIDRLREFSNACPLTSKKIFIAGGEMKGETGAVLGVHLYLKPGEEGAVLARVDTIAHGGEPSSTSVTLRINADDSIQSASWTGHPISLIMCSPSPSPTEDDAANDSIVRDAMEKIALLVDGASPL